MSLISVSRSSPDGADRPRELDLLVGEVAVRVLGELLREDQQAVERRAQLVRHVGQELRLVLRGQRELLGLLLQRRAGLLDLAPAPLDLLVLLGEQARLLLQLLVGLLQLSCCCCSSCVSAWDCFSSSSVRMLAAIVLSTMPMLSVSWSRNERWISLKRLNEASSMTALTSPSKSDRQHDDVERRRLAEAGADLDVVAGDVGQQDALLLDAHWPTSPSPSGTIRQVLALAVGVAGQQLQQRLAARSARSGRRRRAGRRPAAPARRGSGGRRSAGRAGPAACR